MDVGLLLHCAQVYCIRYVSLALLLEVKSPDV